MSGGLTKNSISWAWVAERAKFATKVPMPMPVSTPRGRRILLGTLTRKSLTA